jgi:hypothetical protein
MVQSWLHNVQRHLKLILELKISTDLLNTPPISLELLIGYRLVAPDRESLSVMEAR